MRKIVLNVFVIIIAMALVSVIPLTACKKDSKKENPGTTTVTDE